jgi:hypothetical protein
MARAFKPEGIAFGLALVALGTAWTLANLGRVDLLRALRTWWPLALVLWGVLELVATAQYRRRTGRAS